MVYKIYFGKSEYWFVVLQKNENQGLIGLMMDFYNSFSVSVVNFLLWKKWLRWGYLFRYKILLQRFMFRRCSFSFSLFSFFYGRLLDLDIWLSRTTLLFSFRFSISVLNIQFSFWNSSIFLFEILPNFSQP